jgi:hypothetical protein
MVHRLSQVKEPDMLPGLVRSVGACALLTLSASVPFAGNPGIYPVNAAAQGHTYAEWSAAWWTWYMEHPLAGHPGVDGPFDVASGQTGHVWFLAAPADFGTATPTPRTRHITIHPGIALYVGLVNGEMSSLEGAATEQDQRAVANFQADRIVNVACDLDGAPVTHIENYRFESPQFSFTAPDPWIFSPAPGGAGTSVADGYYVFCKPMSVGQHTLHYSGGFHFEAGIFGPEPFDISLDMTYVITVQP